MLMREDMGCTDDVRSLPLQSLSQSELEQLARIAEPNASEAHDAVVLLLGQEKSKSAKKGEPPANRLADPRFEVATTETKKKYIW